MKKRMMKVFSMMMIAVMLIGVAACVNPTESSAMFLRRYNSADGKWYYVKLPRKKVDMDKLCKMCNKKLEKIAKKKDDFKTIPQARKEEYAELIKEYTELGYLDLAKKQQKRYEKFLTLLDNKPAHSRAIWNKDYVGRYFSTFIYPSLAYNVGYKDYEDKAETKLFHATYDSISDDVIASIMVEYRERKRKSQQDPNWYFNAWVCNAGKYYDVVGTGADPESWGFNWELRCYIN